MRTAFIATLAELADRHADICLLTADLGYTVLEPFARKFPGRFFNVGVAEQNMVGIATGLAAGGFIPFLYSIVNFAALRPYEFIRNGPIVHQLPVRIIGVGGGFDYGHAGISHYGLEDIGVMRIQPGLTVVVPADAAHARDALSKTWNAPGPVYYRIGKGDGNPIDPLKGGFALGRLQIVKEGDGVGFLTMGGVTPNVIQAACRLTGDGVKAGVAVVSSFNPSPSEDVARWLKPYSLAVTVEDHYVTGGLGSFVAEVIAEHRLPCRLLRCGVQTPASGTTGSRDFLFRKYGFSSSQLQDKVLGAMKEIRDERSPRLCHTSDS